MEKIDFRDPLDDIPSQGAGVSWERADHPDRLRIDVNSAMPIADQIDQQLRGPITVDRSGVSHADAPPTGPESGQTGLGPNVAIPGGHLEQLLEGMPPAGATAEQENAKPPTERWQPKQLNARHREIMRRLLEGANYLTIAEEMGIHHQTVMLVATSEVFKTELAKMEASADFTVIRRADDLANEALDNLKVIMRHSRSDANRRAASMDILGIAGYSKIEKKIVGVVSAEDVIKELQSRKRANGVTNTNSE